MQRTFRSSRRGLPAGFTLSLLFSLQIYCPAPARSCPAICGTTCPSAVVQKWQRSHRTHARKMALKVDAHRFHPPRGLDELQPRVPVEKLASTLGCFSSKMQTTVKRTTAVHLTGTNRFKVLKLEDGAHLKVHASRLTDAGVCAETSEVTTMRSGLCAKVSNNLASATLQRDSWETRARSLAPIDYLREGSNQKPPNLLALGISNTITASQSSNVKTLAGLSQQFSPVQSASSTVSSFDEILVSQNGQTSDVWGAMEVLNSVEGGSTYWGKHRLNLFMGKSKRVFNLSSAKFSREKPRLRSKENDKAVSEGMPSSDKPCPTQSWRSVEFLGDVATKREEISSLFGGELEWAKPGVVGALAARFEEASTGDGLLERVEKLRQVIADYSYRYHTLDNPVISDAAFDALVRKLKDLETQLPFQATKESLTAKVGAPPSPTMAKVQHAVPMLSLAAVSKDEELQVWHKRLQQRLKLTSTGEQPLKNAWVVEPKVDGLALSLHYEGGKLVRAATRGDGHQGEDVTHNARNVSGLPEVLSEYWSSLETRLPVLEVRGEIYMTLQNFGELNAAKVKSGEKPFANPRNAAAGSMRLLQARDAEQRHLNFMAFGIASVNQQSDILGIEAPPELARTQWEVLELLKELGFSVNDDNCRFESFDAAQQYAMSWRDKRLNLKYESDGVVFKIDDLATQVELGAVSSDPRWAVAWKFAATEAVTVLEGIDLSIGRTGCIIPTARLKPVQLGGVTISRASLHNFGGGDRLVKKLGICEGDHVVVQRAGDVIPQVVQVLKALRLGNAQVWVPPERCPSCDSKLTICKDNKITSCQNAKCPGRHSRQIEHFAGTLFHGLGPSILKIIQDEGLLADPADFYTLTVDVLSKLDGLSKKSAAKLVKVIQKSREKPLRELLVALGIPTVGNGSAKLLEKWFGSLDRLLRATIDELLLVPGIGKISATAINEWCTNSSNVQLVKRIEEADFSPTTKNPEIDKRVDPSSIRTQETQTTSKKSTQKTGKGSEAESHAPNEGVVDASSHNTVGINIMEATEISTLQGKNVVITGVFENFSRKELEQLVQKNGGQVRKSVNTKTTFIVAGRFPGPSKMVKSAQLGIEVHDLATFQELLRPITLPDSGTQPSNVPALEHAMSGLQANKIATLVSPNGPTYSSAEELQEGIMKIAGFEATLSC